MEKFLVISENPLCETIIFDFEIKEIISLKNGKYENLTEELKKSYKKKKKTVGVDWYKILIGEIVYTSNILQIDRIELKTDSEKELDIFLFDIQIKQIERLLENANIYKLRMENNKPYYTYKGRG